VQIRELAVRDAYVIDLVAHGDARGRFTEWYRADVVASAVGHGLPLAQANHSVSARGALRGVHFALVPPGQAKYVYCPTGRVLDVVVDVRVGSPTFGRWDAVQLDDVDRRALYLPEGLGHGFCALSDDATLAYLCSTTYNPAVERAVHPLDPQIAVEWPVAAPLLSARDDAAPTLAEAGRRGLLPSYAACRSHAATLRGGENQHL